MTNEQNNTRIFDLEERTLSFSLRVLNFCKSLKRDLIMNPLIDQLIRCSTSIGANYCEADDAESKKDFKHKIGISKKEARESKYFLKLIKNLEPQNTEIDNLIEEARQLNLIFNKIYQKVS